MKSQIEVRANDAVNKLRNHLNKNLTKKVLVKLTRDGLKALNGLHYEIERHKRYRDKDYQIVNFIMPDTNEEGYCEMTLMEYNQTLGNLQNYTKKSLFDDLIIKDGS